MPTTATGVALVVKARGNPTAVVGDTSPGLLRDVETSVRTFLSSPSAVLAVEADGIVMLWPRDAVESVGVLTGEQAASLRRAER